MARRCMVMDDTLAWGSIGINVIPMNTAEAVQYSVTQVEATKKAIFESDPV